MCPGSRWRRELSGTPDFLARDEHAPSSCIAWLEALLLLTRSPVASRTDQVVDGPTPLVSIMPSAAARCSSMRQAGLNLSKT
jgi:hypothetical protein